MTSKIVSNMKNSFDDASELDGFEDLRPEDQEKVTKAWEEGKVAESDIPETAKKAEGAAEDEEEKPKKKRAPAKKKAEGEDGEEKPKRSRATKAKVCL